MITLKQLFSSALWFGNSPLTATGQNVLLAFGGILLITGVVLKYLAVKKWKEDIYLIRLFHRLSSLLITIGILWFFLIFFAMQRVAILGLRIWYPAVLVIAMIWGYFVWEYWAKKVPAQKEARQKEIEKNKYLPGNNKK